MSKNTTWLEIVREWISYVSWRVFLWANNWTGEEFHTLTKLSIMRELPQACEHGYNGICAVCDAYNTPPAEMDKNDGKNI